jgi:MFS family permease
MKDEVRQHLRFNWIVNLLDGAFFGFAIGFASFVTVLPLFVSTMTSSAILIGLIPAIHNMGWQLPQLLVAKRMSKMKRFKPMVILMTIQERVPFLGFAAVALLIPILGSQVCLIMTFILLVWQGLAAGFTAAPWQNMIAKIILPKQHGTFYGAQSAIANLLASLSAVLAGIILARWNSPQDFVICFLLACASLAVSWIALASTREPESHIVEVVGGQAPSFWRNIGSILKGDANFRWFLIARMLSQAATMAYGFYTVYAVRTLGLSVVAVGIMTGVYTGTQIAANPIMGWLGDRWSKRSIMEIGVIAAALSALLAWLAPTPEWFYLVFILAGIGNVATWTVSLAMILQFGSESERPSYIGMANTLVAPATILAPLLGGWLAQFSGYSTAFMVSALGGIITAGILHWLVADPAASRLATDVSPIIESAPGEK